MQKKKKFLPAGGLRLFFISPGRWIGKEQLFKFDLENTGIGVSGYIVLLDSKETELRSSNQEASPSAGKNVRVVLVPCYPWKCVSTDISNGEDISEIPGCHLLWQMSFQ